MKISLNGKNTETQSRTLMDLVTGLITDQGLDLKSLVVEHNLKVVPSVAWEKALIQDGDTIELLSFVGGG